MPPKKRPRYTPPPPARAPEPGHRLPLSEMMRLEREAEARRRAEAKARDDALFERPEPRLHYKERRKQAYEQAHALRKQTMRDWQEMSNAIAVWKRQGVSKEEIDNRTKPLRDIIVKREAFVRKVMDDYPPEERKRGMGSWSSDKPRPPHLVKGSKAARERMAWVRSHIGRRL